MRLIELTYTVAGFWLAAGYIPQILKLLRDSSGLAAFSLRKAQIQLACRLLMMPMVYLSIDSWVILSMQTLDVVLRAAEVAAAHWSCRHQTTHERGLAPLVPDRN